MAVFGIIGKPLSHSFSPEYFNAFFLNNHLPHTYIPFTLKSIATIRNLLTEYPDLAGFNVTIPYKKEIIPFLDAIDAQAAQVGAVNTVTVMRTKNIFFLKGYNTDIYGILATLELFDSQPTHALILGTGGAAAATAYVFLQKGIKITFVSTKPVSRSEVLPYAAITAKKMKEFDLIVNTTPLGMGDRIDKFPDIPYPALRPQTIAFDVIYNPHETLFLKKAKEQGCKTFNGYTMLVRQAEEAWKIWSNSKKNNPPYFW
ncbi:MAG: shikimate dehydrogenase [Bacteroidia bacterium]|jgi:shikimate dehydrogenase|nr:shikimate dehydrogenase [Bacteroidales bacterium]MDD2322083.1 shikimate dehydrogenase [Bacteroidales bacterium]MDD3961613.1 shikimate dehydrogenase [Bacteroidales bacterium]MDY0285452.1 shikimate dehydrogenase [Bacteroidales bacterium]NCD40473.1 shikimate dehydrogenase [Bacteroidia bacterium]